MQLNRQYNLHGLFLLSSQSANDNDIVQMDFLVAGQGKLVVGYDKNTRIKHPDYDFATGVHDYQELFMMDARRDDDGNYGLFEIRGLSSPVESFKRMSGPLNAGIKSLSLIQEPGKEKKGSGKNTIILIHGFGLNRKSWYDIAPALAEESMIYMVDLIGSGNSPAPETWPYTIEAQAETIFDFIRNKNLSDIVLVGHSYGGGVALRLLHKMIENGNSTRVKRMVLIAPAAYPQPLPFFIAIPCIPYIGGLLLKWISAEFQIKMTLNRVMYNKTVVTWERINRYKNNIAKPDYQKALIKTAQNVIPKDATTIIEEIKTIEHRVLLIYGDNDSVILKKNLERLSVSLPNADTKILADCGHIPHEEYPERVAGLISNFLLGDNA